LILLWFWLIVALCYGQRRAPPISVTGSSRQLLAYRRLDQVLF